MHVASQQRRARLHAAVVDIVYEVVMKQSLVRLDRIASEMNAWLLAIAIGLGMLDMTVLVAKCLPVLPPLPTASSDAPAAQPPAHALPAPAARS